MMLKLKTTKKVVAVVKPELAPLMRILGVEEVLEVDEVSAESIKRIAESDDIGVVLTQKSLIEKIPSGILEDVQSRLYPIIVVLPDSVEDMRRSSMDVYRDIIRKFIGFELYIKI